MAMETIHLGIGNTMIYYTTATSRNRTRQLKFLVFCSGKSFLPTKNHLPKHHQTKKLHVRRFMKNLGARVGLMVSHSSKIDRIGTFFPTTEFGNRRSRGRFTHILK